MVLIHVFDRVEFLHVGWNLDYFARTGIENTLIRHSLAAYMS